MGLINFFKGITGGGKIIDDYMVKARRMHKETGKPIEECVAIIMAKNKTSKK